MGTQTNKDLFWDGIVKIFKEQQADVRLKACNSDDEGAIFAHKLILSARSEVFKKMFESDECKASSELEQEELEAFVEFIYSDGSILSKKAKQHAMSLYHAADKYEIPHLRDLCRHELITTLKHPSALKVYALAEIPFDKALIDAAFNVIRSKIKIISRSTEFECFVVDHPNLTVQIFKAISGCNCPTSFIVSPLRTLKKGP